MDLVNGIFGHTTGILEAETGITGIAVVIIELANGIGARAGAILQSYFSF